LSPATRLTRSAPGLASPVPALDRLPAALDG
jgi:hypothetical protein